MEIYAKTLAICDKYGLAQAEEPRQSPCVSLDPTPVIPFRMDRVRALPHHVDCGDVQPEPTIKLALAGAALILGFCLIALA